jgi:hypothetical protein
MNPKELENQLHSEGFRHAFVWQDGPSAFYPDHTHPVETAHIILDGEMTLTVNGKRQPSAPASAATFLQPPCTPRAWARSAAAT